MIVQAVHSKLTSDNGVYHKTVYTSLKDPITNKEVTDTVVYIYNKVGKIESLKLSGTKVDVKT
jgi:hypothetical protein